MWGYIIFMFQIVHMFLKFKVLLEFLGVGVEPLNPYVNVPDEIIVKSVPDPILINFKVYKTMSGY